MDKIILFDLDGTLIDSTEAILESFEAAFAEFGVDVASSEDIKALIGHPLDYMFEHLGVDKEVVWDYVAAYKRHYRQISCQKTVLLPKAIEAIQKAKEFAILGIVTTKTALYSKEMLEYMGVMEYFDVLIGREDVQNPKPHPEPIQKALLKLPKVSNVWMIGDTCMDMQSAKASGIGAIGVECGYGCRDELSQCADLIMSNCYEAVTHLSTFGSDEKNIAF
jgi:phosphoglycolate phosphatase